MHDKHSTNFLLDWPKRYKIAMGAAQGLAYLHLDCSPPIVHRDIKSSNILLDADFNAYVADFGVAKLMQHQHSNQTLYPPNGDPHMIAAGSADNGTCSYVLTSRVAGSYGYIAPGNDH